MKSKNEEQNVIYMDPHFAAVPVSIIHNNDDNTDDHDDNAFDGYDNVDDNEDTLWWQFGDDDHDFLKGKNKYIDSIYSCWINLKSFQMFLLC